MIGYAYFGTQQYGEAYVYLRRAKNYAELKAHGNPFFDPNTVTTPLLQMVQCKIARKDYAEAMKLANECEEWLTKSEDPDFIKSYLGDVYLYKTICLRKMGEYQAAYDLIGKAVRLLSKAMADKGAIATGMMNKAFLSVLLGNLDHLDDMKAFYFLDDTITIDGIPIRELGPHISQNAMKKASALDDEDVHTFLLMLKNHPLVGQFNDEEQMGFARHRSSAHVCHFFREKSRYI